MDSLFFIEHFRYLGLFGLLILGGVGFPFPEDITFILAGILLSQEVIEPLPAFVSLYSGLLIADVILYLIGRKFGRRIASCWPFTSMLSPERFAQLEHKFSTKGTPYILLGRHLPGLRAQLFIVAGVMKMSMVRFILADAFSAVFSVFIWGGAGYVFGYKVLSLKERFTEIEHTIILPAIGLAVAAGLVYVLVKYLKGRRRGLCEPGSTGPGRCPQGNSGGKNA
jgi:membrane protein DedA with SNARE-associated domain